MKRFVVDTNVVVSGLITAEASAPSVRVLERMLTGDFTFVLSPDLIRHYETTLNRPSLAGVHGLHRWQIETLVTVLTANAVIRDPARSQIRASGPADQYLIDLVTADPQHVLVAGDMRLSRAKLDISIVSPAGLLKLLEDRVRAASVRS